jgi:glutamine synthetase
MGSHSSDISTTAGIGRSGFVAEHGLHTAEQLAAAEEVLARVDELGLRTIRVIVVDQHGQPRAKFLSPRAAAAAFTNGVDFSGAIYSLDTGNHVFPPAFADGGGIGIEELTGFPDVVIVPDPLTFQVLPWAPDTGWVICDAYFSSGRPMPLDGRRLLRQQLDRLAARGLRYLSGLEVEFNIVRRTTPLIGLDRTGQPGPPPDVDVFQLGYQYLSEVRMDSVIDTLTALRDGLDAVGLLPRSMEDEWGPGQMEFSLSPLEGLGSADAMVLFRSAVKQICARRGLLASFMCWPHLPNFFPSGWHLHGSLLDGKGANVFASADEVLSPTARSYLAGVLEHATAMTPFATPTINGIRRFRPYSFAPDRVAWAVENRGALVRVQGGPGDSGTHLENRLGEPAANPYLYLAADIAAGLDGIERELTPPDPIAGNPYESDAPTLPTTMAEALDALDGDAMYREQFGEGFVDYFLMMKREEVTRAGEEAGGLLQSADDPDAASREWEMREYFEFF